MPFVHLHVHSAYSFLDGLNVPETLAQRAAAIGCPALALTDHGGMHGAIAHYHACQTHRIKPIIGSELYICRSIDERTSHDKSALHLLLLAMNKDGYKNLVKLCSIANTEGFYYHPRIDHNLLAAHNSGLICTTGCPKSEVPNLILQERYDEAEERLKWYLDVFGDRLYVELQEHSGLDYRALNRRLVELARKYGLPLLATNDAHYAAPEDAHYHDIMLCLQKNSLISDPKRLRFPDSSFYLKSPSEMLAIFAEFPEAIHNTLVVAERCEGDVIAKSQALPRFATPSDFADEEAYFEYLCQIGFEARYGIPSSPGAWRALQRPPRPEDCVIFKGQGGDEDYLTVDPAGAPRFPALDPDRLRERLRYEIDTITRLGFARYMLIVWDIIRFCRQNRVLWNVRGSAAGSMACYALGLTRIEPVTNELYFERFLNPQRVNMPDIDIDFPDDQRELVADYTVARYGQDRVAQIVTIQTLGARAAIRAAGRILGLPIPTVAQLAEVVPPPPSRLTLKQMEADERYTRISSEIPELHRTALALEGVLRAESTHAAGIAISACPLEEFLPVQRPKGKQIAPSIQRVTQYDMSALDKLNVLKMDYLGLSQLRTIRLCLDLIARRHGMRLCIDDIPLSDPAIYELLSRGDVVGLFQVESDGMRRVLVEMQPRRFGDIVATLSLYRPGPMEYIDEYIACMHNRKSPDYLGVSELQAALQDTYGIIVYQEQIMRIARDFAGYSMGEADTIRKAVGKKDEAALHAHREKFINGAVAKGHPVAVAEAVWARIEYFANYGFNRSHASAYAMMTAITAFLKARYPLEYYAAIMSVESSDLDRLSLLVRDARTHGFTVLHPDVNASEADFSVVDDRTLRVGILPIKGVGERLAQLIPQRRPYADITALRTKLGSQINKRHLEALIKAGALDAFGSRIALLEQVEGKGSGAQLSLFEPVTIKETSEFQRREMEKEVLGFALTPLTIPQSMRSLAQARIDQLTSGSLTSIAGLVTDVAKVKSKAGQDMAFVTIEDESGQFSLTVFPDLWRQCQALLKVGEPIAATVCVDNARTDRGIARSMWCNGKFFKVEHSKQAGRWVAA